MNVARPVALAVLALSLAGCADSSKRNFVVASSSNLKFIRSIDIEIEDPSGLCLSNDGQSLWVVCNQSNRIYRIDLDGQ